MQAAAKLSNRHDLRVLFWVCWVVYFLSYIGRLNYAASMVEIGLAEGYSKSQLGLVTTVLFFCYGGGQILSGFIGDILSPRKLVFWGVFGSACCNVIACFLPSIGGMAFIWGCNGLLQALIWSPMIRLFSLYMPDNYLYKSCLNIQTSCAAGTCATYVLSAALIFFFSWHAVFAVTAFLLFGAAIIWEIFIRRTERAAATAVIQNETATTAQSGGAAIAAAQNETAVTTQNGATANTTPAKWNRNRLPPKPAASG